MVFKPSISLFSAKRNDSTSATKPPTVAATLRSEATLAEIACKEENTQKRKFSDKYVNPDLSLITKNEDSNKENAKKKKVDYRFNMPSGTEEEQENRRSQLKDLVDKFISDSNLTVYELPSDLNGHDRKMIHEIASELSLEHDSVGSGKKRRIVLKKKVNSDARNIKNIDMLPRRDVLPGERPITPPNSIENKINKLPQTSNKHNSPMNSVHKARVSSPKAEKDMIKKNPKTKAFSKLFEGVKFVISGYQNPLRGEIRRKALDMGAKYCADWDNTCTHLVCAFINTPKFNQVRNQSKSAKIVKSDWIEKCYKDKIRYPWRRHCLDSADKNAEESEEELWDEKTANLNAVNNTSTISDMKVQQSIEEDPYDKDTDDEIDEVLRETKLAEENRSHETPQKHSAKDDLDASSSLSYKENSSSKTEVLENSDDAYNADTDVDEDSEYNEESKHPKLDIAAQKHSVATCDNDYSNRNNSEIKQCDDFFAGISFLFYGLYCEDEARKMKKCISVGGGSIEKFMNPKVDYIIAKYASNDWDRNMELALKENSHVKIAQSQFILDCYKEQKLLKDDKYFITENK